MKEIDIIARLHGKGARIHCGRGHCVTAYSIIQWVSWQRADQANVWCAKSEAHHTSPPIGISTWHCRGHVACSVRWAGSRSHGQCCLHSKSRPDQAGSSKVTTHHGSHWTKIGHTGPPSVTMSQHRPHHQSRTLLHSTASIEDPTTAPGTIIFKPERTSSDNQRASRQSGAYWVTALVTPRPSECIQNHPRPQWAAAGLPIQDGKRHSSLLKISVRPGRSWQQGGVADRRVAQNPRSINRGCHKEAM